MPTPGNSGAPGPDQGARANEWIEVAAGLAFRDGKLLITQRPSGTHLQGLWEFPGGKREPGETWESCLVRELREELDVAAEVGTLFEEVRHQYPAKSVHLRFYLCRLLGEPRAVQCAAVAWVERNRLRDFAFPDADATLLQRLETTPSVWVD